MRWTFNDGGRAAAGFKGSTRDCVCRAIAIATGKPYADVYADLNDLGTRERRSKRRRRKSSARIGVHIPTIRRYLAGLGWTWTPTMRIGQGCTVHLNERELPRGRLIVSVSRHLTTVIDGVIHDTHDPNERGVTIYPKSTPADVLPKKAVPLPSGNGWSYTPERCVYGYWTKEA